MNLGNIGMSSAAGFYQSVVGFICILTANGIVRKIEPSSSLF
jgi:putative aldouronate transport system permease protein